MSARILWGFGGIEFSRILTVGSTATTATFSGASGNLVFTPVYKVRKEDVDGNIISRLKGYRLTAQCNEIINLADTDYLQYQALANILTDIVSEAEQRTVTVKVRNDSGVALEYEFILDSDFAPQDLHRIKIGQVLSLNLTCPTLQLSIPSTISGIETKNWVFETSDGVQENAVFETSDTVQENAVFKE